MTTNEELQQQLDAMREEVRQLREQLLSAPAPAEESRGVMTRRNLLRAAPIAAIGGAVAAMSASPAAAAVGNPVLLGKSNTAAGATTEISGGAGSDAAPALAYQGGLTGDWLVVGFGPNQLHTAVNDGDPLLRTFTLDSYAAEFVAGAAPFIAAGGHDLIHVLAFGPGSGLIIEATDHVYGQIDGSIATDRSNGIEITAGQGVGVTTTVTGGVAYEASCDDGQAFVATATSPTTAKDAVTIDYAGTSRALYAQSHNPTNINGTITGVNEGHGIGVWGEQRNSTGAGIGVVGVAGSHGRGSQFTGGVAQTRLVPGTAATHPTTGKTGDLYVDSTVRLWFCTKASAGSTPAVWKQLG
ncbi:MAG: hypothetical protein QOG75_5633 [Mycobacterium sp.]|nr:hypothetical protein [Mycobacterium sp.]